MNALPEAAKLWKLNAARDLILSAFQQNLYAEYERPFAYWLTAQVIDQHLHTLETLSSMGGVGKRCDVLFTLEY